MASAIPKFFATARAFRTWLQKHHDQTPELLVGFRKRGTADAGITWREAVDQALCFGWVDGVRRRLDDHAYVIRFTPRRPGSTWSAVNIRRVADLESQELMTEAGLAAFGRRSQKKSRSYSYERTAQPTLDKDLEKLLKADRKIFEFHRIQAPSYQRKAVHWIMSAKSDETRKRRLNQLMSAYAKGRRL